MKKLSLGILLGITAVVAMGIVYIDTVKNYWQYASGFIVLVVNTNVQGSFTVGTNTGFVGINTNSDTYGVTIVGSLKSAPGGNFNGADATTSGGVAARGGIGGDGTNTGFASGGTGGQLSFIAGMGGGAPNSTGTANGGNGGVLTFLGGTGGGLGMNSVNTNLLTGGTGGNSTIAGGGGGQPDFAATNTVGGNGGSASYNGGPGGSPVAGWARRGGNGGALNLAGGFGVSGVRTNGGNGGAANLTGGAGASATLGGSAGSAGNANITGGAGADGNSPGTNSNGGDVVVNGGAGGTGALVGDVKLASTRGGVRIGISNSAFVTNIVFVRTNLDFPSTLTGASSDLVAVAITGRTNAIVNVGVPPSALVAGGFYTGFCSNGIAFVRFCFFGAVSANPVAGDFEVEIKAYR